jgi:hypothetical protein
MRSGMLQGWGMVAGLLFLAVAPAALLMTLWYLFSRARAAAVCFRVVWWTIVSLNLVLLVSGLWHFVMIEVLTYDLHGVEVFSRLFLPTTVIVLAAKPLKSRIASRAAHSRQE